MILLMTQKWVVLRLTELRSIQINQSWLADLAGVGQAGREHSMGECAFPTDS